MNNENLLQKVEEKIVALLAEMETMRKELMRLKSENTFLRSDQDNHAQKLKELISLLDVLEGSESRAEREEISA